MTQTSSKHRVKEDGIGEDAMKSLYEQFELVGTDDFRLLCKNIIESSNGKAETKAKFLDMLDASKSKNVMVVKVTNYFLAGEGKGV